MLLKKNSVSLSLLKSEGQFANIGEMSRLEETIYHGFFDQDASPLFLFFFINFNCWLKLFQNYKKDEKKVKLSGHAHCPKNDLNLVA